MQSEGDGDDVVEEVCYLTTRRTIKTTQVHETTSEEVLGPSLGASALRISNLLNTPSSSTSISTSTSTSSSSFPSSCSSTTSSSSSTSSFAYPHLLAPISLGSPASSSHRAGSPCVRPNLPPLILTLRQLAQDRDGPSNAPPLPGHDQDSPMVTPSPFVFVSSVLTFLYANRSFSLNAALLGERYGPSPRSALSDRLKLVAWRLLPLPLLAASGHPSGQLPAFATAFLPRGDRLSRSPSSLQPPAAAGHFDEPVHAVFVNHQPEPPVGDRDHGRRTRQEVGHLLRCQRPTALPERQGRPQVRACPLHRNRRAVTPVLENPLSQFMSRTFLADASRARSGRCGSRSTATCRPRSAPPSLPKAANESPATCAATYPARGAAPPRPARFLLPIH